MIIFFITLAICFSIIFLLISGAKVEPTIEKTYIFNKEFDEKLISLGCKTQFLRNLNNDCVKNDGILSDEINVLKKEKDWTVFIMGAFHWINTPEGHIYWSKIANS